jgi:hypothetical protein
MAPVRAAWEYRFATRRTIPIFRDAGGPPYKVPAQRTEVIGCDLEDGAGGTSSLAIDVSNDGAVLVRDNQFEKGQRSANHTAAVMIGAEGVTQPTPDIIAERNTLIVEGNYRSFLIDNRTSARTLSRGNILRGNAMALLGDGTVQ